MFELEQKSSSALKIAMWDFAHQCYGWRHLFSIFPLAETAPHPKYLFALYGGECDEANGKEEASMLDPKECRRYALECVWLAQVPEFPQARKAYLSAAKTWLKLANELGFATAIEKSQRLTEQDDFEYKNAS